MTPKAIQPWGRAPTPLIPTSVIKEFGYLDAPQTIKKFLGNNATLAELGESVWDSVDSVSSECLAEIVDILRPHFNNFKHLQIYSGTRLSRSFESLPFSRRTRNVVMSNPDKFSEPQLRFSDVISIYSFGVRSAIEFACVVESAANSPLVDIDVRKNSKHDNMESVEFSKINLMFQMIAAWALGEQKLESLAEALPEPLPEWPNEIKKTWVELNNVKTKQLAGDVVKRYSVPDLVAQGLGNMDDRLVDIAQERIFAFEPVVTLEELGCKFGITRERVRQLEQKALSNLERFKSNEYLPVLRRAQSLGDKLGTAVPMGHSALEDSLDWAVDDFRKDCPEKQLARSLLFWLAGPYHVRQSWLLRGKELPTQTTEALLECRDQRGVIAHSEAHEIMSSLGIKVENHQAWLEHLQVFLHVEEGLIHFQGSILNKAHSLLQYFDRPMNVEEMLEYIDSDSVRSVRQLLMNSSRFWRINKQNEFVLAGTEGYDEYTRITDEIIQELELCGGQAPISHLVEKLSRVYGVKENSVVSYLSTPRFTKDENSIVRVRDIESGINIKTDISKSMACYLSDGGIWSWRIKVDKDTVRGSSRLIPNAFAQQLGCDVGDKIEVPTDLGPVTLSWSLDSTTGAHIGSLRKALDFYGAGLGDYLFIKATKPNVTFTFLKQEQVESVNSNLVKLALLLGRIGCRTEDESIFEIATALDINQVTDETTLTEARQRLASKGESELAQLIPQPRLSVDGYINDMGRLFK